MKVTLVLFFVLITSGLAISAGPTTAPTSESANAGRNTAPAAEAAPRQPNWRQILSDRVPLYGHRNWIIIADSAYPAQCSPGIETIETGADQIEVVGATLDALAASRHVRPIIYTDSELKFVTEADAPGISAYRAELRKLLPAEAVQSLPHEQIISKLDAAGKTFRVLILKTRLTIPYTSVFLQLDCAYWDGEKEKRLRAAMDFTDGK